jgi:hypothetical protein
LGDLGIIKDNTKMDLTKTDVEISTELTQWPVIGFCQHGNKFYDAIKLGKL